MLPLLKRKKAAATCTLSLTNVSVHRSVIPFPASSDTDIPSLASTSAIHAPSPSPPRQRTNASLLCRKRCARQVEPEYPQSITTTSSPRKRARKASLSSLYPRKPSLFPHKHHTLAAALGFGPGSLALTGDLKFLCNVYRSIASTKLKREFAKAEKRLFDDASMRMDVDMDIMDIDSREELDEQETIFMDRLRSYLIFHEINPQWLDVTPHSITWVNDMQIVDDPSSSAPSTTPPLLPINPQPQIIASLLFRHRHRVKLTHSSAKSRLLAKVACAEQYGGWKRRTIPKSPLVVDL
ncbi:hypothetical protein Agabi119p4_3817 [Agaricus bisporus var. burnettii]|uniref:Uncharacterized protein n=1 Tax=Agaricus bisporus var. burnettii TaxID=192524 RepID=A0A8H7KIH3_AGABI|nr:hypothetical protein Agabi119p4_3817 [Agaricus bisporus var. burnettii]